MVGNKIIARSSRIGSVRKSLVLGATVAMFSTMAVSGADAAYVADANAPAGALAVVLPAVDAFETSFRPLASCLGNPTILFEDLPGRRGEYRVGSSTVAVNPNRVVADMAQVVVHELAHHLMIACKIDSDQQFQKAFYASQGIPESIGWYDYSDGWAATPAEQFAEAVSQMVLSTSTGRINIAPPSVDLVRGLAGETSDPSIFVPKRAATGTQRSTSNRDSYSAITEQTLRVALEIPGPTRRTSLGGAVGLAGRVT